MRGTESSCDARSIGAIAKILSKGFMYGTSQTVSGPWMEKFYFSYN
jgi:hypothetical protein